MYELSRNPPPLLVSSDRFYRSGETILIKHRKYEYRNSKQIRTTNIQWLSLSGLTAPVLTVTHIISLYYHPFPDKMLRHLNRENHPPPDGLTSGYHL